MKITDFGLCKEGIVKLYQIFLWVNGVFSPEMILKKGYSKCWYLLGILFYEMLFGNSPFLSDNKDDLFKNILEKNVHFFPDYISKECQIFINSLLSGNLKDVIEIKNHSYFKDVNWNKVYYKNLHVPKYKIDNNKNCLYNNQDYFKMMLM